MSLIEDAKSEARREVCCDCNARGCCDESICDIFKTDVKSILAEWAAEESNSLGNEMADCFDKIIGK